MADFAALPLFTDAVIADCNHLTDAELGLYLRILILMWRSPECRIPNDDVWVSRKLSRPVESFKPLLIEFCKTSGNWWVQKRLKKEWDYLHAQRKKKSDAAKVRWYNEKDTCTRNATPLHSTPNQPSTTKTPTPSVTTSAGVYKIEGGMKNYDVMHHISDAALLKAKQAVDGWDIYRLIGVYNESIRSGARDIPRNINAAFPAWCPKYTKGKPPQ